MFNIVHSLYMLAFFALVAMITCSFCGKHTVDVRTYVKHVGAVHRSEPNFILKCGIGGCPMTYTRYSSFTSHLYRKHQTAIEDVANKDILRDNSRLQCLLCDCSFANFKECNVHLIKHLQSGDMVQCPVRDCMKEYTVISSFKSHFSRCHKNIGFEFEHQLDLSTEYETLEHLEPGPSETEGTAESNSSIMTDNENFDMVSDENDETFFKMLLQSFLKLQEFEHLPVSTMDKIVDEMKISMSVSYEQTKKSVLDVLSKANVSSETQNLVSKEFDNNIHMSNLERLDTAFKRQSCADSYFPANKPVTISLGLNSKYRKRTYQYVPILESLKVMLQNSQILSSVVNGSGNTDENILCDFADGSYYNTNDLFRTQPVSLQVVLYYDEFEVVNPLGSKRGIHKLGAMYMSLGNVNVLQRSELKTVQLCVLCPVVDIKEFGLDKIFEPIVYDLKILEGDGIFISELKQNIKGTVSYICSDNLGSHQIGGFMESFGPNVSKPCRYCLASSAEIQDNFLPSNFIERDRVSYNHQVSQVEKDSSLARLYGVKKGSILNELAYFHVCRGLPPDCMHDLLEGCAKKEIPLVLKKIVMETDVTEEGIISCLHFFDYGKCDVDKKPTEPKSLANLYVQSAAQMWTLIRFLPLIVGHLIPENNKAWSIFLLLKDIVEIVMSPIIHRKLCPYLQTLITDHHRLFKEVFPEVRLTPKHHYLIHYPDMLLRFGPIRSCWCMQFEAKHSYFKQLSIRLRNYKHLSSTLATRHQRFQSVLSGSYSEHHEPNVKVTSCTPVSSLSECNVIRTVLEENDQNASEYMSVKKVIYKHVSYYVGSHIITGFCSDEPILTRIKFILVESDNVIFVGKCYAGLLNSHLGAYELVERDQRSPTGLGVVNTYELLDRIPLDAYCVKDKEYCVFKHYVFNDDF